MTDEQKTEHDGKGCCAGKHCCSRKCCGLKALLLIALGFGLFHAGKHCAQCQMRRAAPAAEQPK
jgi:hypothetical protein